MATPFGESLSEPVPAWDHSIYFLLSINTRNIYHLLRKVNTSIVTIFTLTKPLALRAVTFTIAVLRADAVKIQKEFRTEFTHLTNSWQ
jgi:hypothetical protein